MSKFDWKKPREEDNARKYGIVPNGVEDTAPLPHVTEGSQLPSRQSRKHVSTVKKCSLCGKELENVVLLKQHMRVAHSGKDHPPGAERDEPQRGK